MNYDTIEAMVDAPYRKETASKMDDPYRSRYDEIRNQMLQILRTKAVNGTDLENVVAHDRLMSENTDTLLETGADYRDDYRDSRDYARYRDSDYRRPSSRSRSPPPRRRSPPRRSGGSSRHRRRRSPSPPVDEASCDRRTVFVMQLSARARPSDLEDFFSQAGRVRAARVIEDRVTGRSKGVGYVEFYEEESVAKAIALTGQKILGIPVIAKHTESEKNRLAAQAAAEGQQEVVPVPEQPKPAPIDISQHRLYVGSVNFDLNENDLREVLDPFGPIEFINLHRDPVTGKSKGFAFVQYRNAEDAKVALQEMNGYELAGRPLKVDSAGYHITSQQRIDIMHKLMARGESPQSSPTTVPAPGLSPSSTPAPAPAPALVPTAAASTFVPPPLVVGPSRAVLLKNMFSDEDKTDANWAPELAEDIKDEAQKSGQVVHIQIEEETQGDVFLKFDSIASASAAVQALGGRFFAGKQIVASFFPEILYNARFPKAANL
ncbi:hypothetical protein DFQ27_001087 [Actinomortierella ambigua]|uniref:RRM domain-containing protein n=1 Tax=Actinomortierella ambigua TaxID=1343610 RepID=A0A9P6U8W6_9FUNG|nr:hypothetical protein DFQ27_001087 [Actinomortierella ambigua]